MTENPRVGGSIPPLATNVQNVICWSVPPLECARRNIASSKPPWHGMASIGRKLNRSISIAQEGRTASAKLLYPFRDSRTLPSRREPPRAVAGSEASLRDKCRLRLEPQCSIRVVEFNLAALKRGRTMYHVQLRAALCGRHGSALSNGPLWCCDSRR